MSFKQLRKRAGFTQTSLARAVGVGKSYISQLESGRRNNPGAAVLARLVLTLGPDILASLARKEVQQYIKEDLTMEDVAILQLDDIIGEYRLLDYNDGTNTIPAEDMATAVKDPWMNELTILPDGKVIVAQLNAKGECTTHQVQATAAEPDYYIGDYFAIKYDGLLLVLSGPEGMYRFSPAYTGAKED